MALRDSLIKTRRALVALVLCVLVSHGKVAVKYGGAMSELSQIEIQSVEHSIAPPHLIDPKTYRAIAAIDEIAALGKVT
jgi:hypothetical protein